ncbi:hypothetical protein G6F59_014465 [Rhizopus arrhizus]|nr:hypothetical protein G6F59_014465 [Rhizopus arrhizus]
MRRATDLPEPEMPVTRTTFNMDMIVARFFQDDAGGMASDMACSTAAVWGDFPRDGHGCCCLYDNVRAGAAGLPRHLAPRHHGGPGRGLYGLSWGAGPGRHRRLLPAPGRQAAGRPVSPAAEFPR